jgi:anti-sigma factor RsiW
MSMPLRLRRRNDLVCQQVVELVTDYLEGTMSRSERRRFDTHLRACPNCSAYLRQMRATIQAMGRLSTDDVAPAALDELTEMFRHWQTEGPEPSEGSEG